MQRLEDGIAAIDADADDNGDQPDREHDQVIAYPQHGLLEVADGVCRFHQAGGLAEIGLATCGIDQGADLAAPDDRTGEHGVPRLLADGQRLPGQCGLVDGDLVTLEQPGIGRHDVAQAQADDVARDNLFGGRGDPLAVPLDAGP